MVMVYSDKENLGLELLSKGRELADEKGTDVTAVLIGADKSAAERYIKHGADKVFLVKGPEGDLKAEETAGILEDLIKETGDDIILISSNKTGKETAPRLSACLGAGSVTDSNKLYIKDGALFSERVVYSGNAVAVEKFNDFPAVVTVPSKTYDPLPEDSSRTGEIEEKEMEVRNLPSKVIDTQKMKQEGVNVEEAEIIVSCGRGLKSSEDIHLINDLAEVLKGNTVGCSRPIAADLKWLSEDHWIGLSGHKVKPKLYVACGISGQIQHVAGMRDSGIILAINKDPDAPIFKSADYGIVGDLYEVLPKLISGLKERQ